MKRKCHWLIACLFVIVFLSNSNKAFAFGRTFTMDIKNKNYITSKMPTASIVSFVNKFQTSLLAVSINKNAEKIQPSLKVIQNKPLDQFDLPAKGEEIAVITTNKGTIFIKLLPQYAPKTVEIFKKRINDGFYNGVSFNKIIKNSMIQAGVTGQSTPTTGASQLDDSCLDVRNFRGAVATAISDTGSTLDQFVIVEANSDNIDNVQLSYMNNSDNPPFPSNILNKYKKIGGMPWLDSHNVVFGQVIDSQRIGMKIPDKIAKLEVDENNKPKKDVKIIKIELLNYR